MWGAYGAHSSQGVNHGPAPLVDSVVLPTRSSVRVMVLAHILERCLAIVGEVGLMRLEARPDVPMPSFGVLAESISIGRAGHVYLRHIASTFVGGRPGRPRLCVSDRGKGEKATERHKPTKLRDDLRSLAVAQFGDLRTFAHLPARAHVLT